MCMHTHVHVQAHTHAHTEMVICTQVHMYAYVCEGQGIQVQSTILFWGGGEQGLSLDRNLSRRVGWLVMPI